MEAAFNYLNFNYEDLRSLLQDLQEGHEPSKVSFAVLEQHFNNISTLEDSPVLNIVFSVVQFVSKILTASKILPIPSLARLLQTRSSEEVQFPIYFIGRSGVRKTICPRSQRNR